MERCESLTRASCLTVVAVALFLLASLAASSSSAATVTRDCGKVRLHNPEQSFPVYMRTQNVRCRTAVYVVTKTLFGQGSPPPLEFTCYDTTSERGFCIGSGMQIAYATSRRDIPKFGGSRF